MAQIRSKQIAEFLNTVDWGVITDNDIANASDIKQYVDDEISGVDGDATASIDSLETALSADIVTAESDAVASAESLDDVLSGEISTEIFNEVSTLESIDNVLSDALNAEINTTNGEIIDINASIGDLETALNAEINTTNGEIIDINASIGDLETALNAEINTTNGEIIDINTSIDDLDDSVDSLESIDDVLDGRITTLEDTIIQDTEFKVEEFAGNAAEITSNANNLLVITLEENIQNDLRGLVWVFINGVYAPIDSVSDNTVTLNTLDYSLDATDIVKVQYQYEV